MTIKFPFINSISLRFLQTTMKSQQSISLQWNPETKRRFYDFPIACSFAYGWHMIKQFYDIKEEWILCIHSSDIFSPHAAFRISAFNHKLDTRSRITDIIFFYLTFFILLPFLDIIGVDNNVIHRFLGIDI